MNFFAEINRLKLNNRLKLLGLLTLWVLVLFYIAYDYNTVMSERNLISHTLTELNDKELFYTAVNEDDIDVEKETLLIDEYRAVYDFLNNVKYNVSEHYFINSQDLTDIKRCFPEEANVSVIDCTVGLNDVQLELSGDIPSMEGLTNVLQNLENTGLFTGDINVNAVDLNLTENQPSEGNTGDIRFIIRCAINHHITGE